MLLRREGRRHGSVVAGRCAGGGRSRTSDLLSQPNGAVTMTSTVALSA